MAENKLDATTLDAETRIMCFVNGRDETGAPSYAYIMVRPSLYPVFINSDISNIDIERFGETFISGKGMDAPDNIKKIIYEGFGFDDDFSEKLKVAHIGMIEQIKLRLGKV